MAIQVKFKFNSYTLLIIQVRKLYYYIPFTTFKSIKKLGL